MTHSEAPEDEQFKVVDEEEDMLAGLSKTGADLARDSSGNVISRDELRDLQKRGPEKE